MAPVDRTIPLGPWRPDNSDFAAGTLKVAEGCIAKETGFEPMRGLASITSTVLPGVEKATALVVGTDTTAVGNTRTFGMVGNAIYEATGSPLVWTDVSKVGGYATATEDKWRAAQFAGNLYATNFTDPVQFASMAGGDFADTGATGIPTAKYIAVIRDLHLVLGFVNDPTDGIVNNRIAWSPQEDPLGDWTDIATNADKAEIQNLGEITGITGGEFGVVLSRKGISKLLYTGGLPAFQRQTVTDEVGCSFPASVIRAGQLTYWWDESGVYVFDGAQVVPLGDQWVNEWLEMEQRAGQEFRISPSVDRQSRVVRWAFVATGSQGDVPNRILQLKPALGQRGFTYYDPPDQVRVLGDFVSPGFNMDNMDAVYPSLDDPGLPSLDDPFWQEGSRTPGAILENGEVATFRGDTAPAQWDYPEGQLSSAAQRVKVLASLPITDGGTPTVQIGTRRRLNDSVSFAAAVSQQEDGTVPHRDEARYHTLRVRQSGSWLSATGLQVSGETTGTRG